MNRVGACFELPRPLFREWLFGMRPSIEVTIDEEEGGELSVLKVSHKGCSLQASCVWPSLRWAGASMRFKSQPDSSISQELPGRT